MGYSSRVDARGFRSSSRRADAALQTIGDSGIGYNVCIIDVSVYVAAACEFCIAHSLACNYK